MTKICEICGGEYEPYPPRQKYQRTCSPDCSYKLTKRRSCAWLSRHPEALHKSYERRVARRAAYPMCRICGCPVVEVDDLTPRAKRRQTHEACVLRDSMDTIRHGGTPSHMQLQRLYARGYTLADVREMLREEVAAHAKSTH